MTKYNYVSRSTVLRGQYVTSSKLLFNFTVDQLKEQYVDILSVLNDKILVSFRYLVHLFIYNHEGRHLSTIAISGDELVQDATWTISGNIVYTTTYSHIVVVMSESGRVITTHTHLTKPFYFSVSNDGIIYLADWERGVYQSTNDGLSWSLVFNSTNGWHCWQAIRVTIDQSDNFWTLQHGDNDDNHLRVYNVDRRRADGNVTWRDINVTTIDARHIHLSSFSRLSYDDNVNIFLSDFNNKTIHVLLLIDQYHCQLLSSHHIQNEPKGLAVDNKRQQMYVGQESGLVEVFKLTYRHGSD